MGKFSSDELLPASTDLQRGAYIHREPVPIEGTIHEQLAQAEQKIAEMQAIPPSSDVVRQSQGGNFHNPVGAPVVYSGADLWVSADYIAKAIQTPAAKFKIPLASEGIAAVSNITLAIDVTELAGSPTTNRLIYRADMKVAANGTATGFIFEPMAATYRESRAIAKFNFVVEDGLSFLTVAVYGVSSGWYALSVLDYFGSFANSDFLKQTVVEPLSVAEFDAEQARGDLIPAIKGSVANYPAHFVGTRATEAAKQWLNVADFTFNNQGVTANEGTVSIRLDFRYAIGDFVFSRTLGSGGRSEAYFRYLAFRGGNLFKFAAGDIVVRQDTANNTIYHLWVNTSAMDGMDCYASVNYISGFDLGDDPSGKVQFVGEWSPSAPLLGAETTALLQEPFAELPATGTGATVDDLITALKAAGMAV